MIRKTIIILLAILFLGAISDWQRFKERARPAVVPLVDWIEDRTERDDIDLAVPRGPDLSGEPSLLQDFFDEVRQSSGHPADDRQSLREELERWRRSEVESGGSKVELIETSLSRLRRELQQVQEAIRLAEEQTAAEYDHIRENTPERRDREQQVVELEARHQRRVAVLEERRDLLEQQIERTESMRAEQR